MPLGLSLLTVGISAVTGIALVFDPMVFISVTVGAPALVIMMMRTRQIDGLVLLCVLLPVATYVKAFTGFRYGPLSLDIGIVLLCALVLGDRVLTGSLRLGTVDALVIIFILLGLMQLLNAYSPGLLYGLEGFRILVLPTLGLLIGRWLPMDGAKLLKVVRVLVLTATVVGAFGIYQWFFPSRFDEEIVSGTSGDPITFTSLGTRRAFSTLPSPGHLGYLVAFGIIAGIALLEVTTKTYSLFLGIGIMSVCSVLTIIRTGWVGVCVGLTLYLLLCGRRRTLRAATRVAFYSMLIIGLAVIVGMVLPSDTFVVRMDSLLNLPAEPHYVSRVTSWRETILPAIIQNPLGYGLGSDATHARALFFAHSGYFYLAVEMGIAGLVIALLSLCWELPKIWRAQFAYDDPFLQTLATMLVSWIGALLVMGSFGALLEVYPINFYTWFLLGATSQVVRRKLQRNVVADCDRPGASAWALT